MAIEKLKITTRLKYKTRTNLQIKHHNNHELSLINHRHDTELRTHEFKFLTPSTPAVKKTVNLHGSM